MNVSLTPHANVNRPKDMVEEMTLTSSYQILTLTRKYRRQNVEPGHELNVLKSRKIFLSLGKSNNSVCSHDNSSAILMSTAQPIFVQRKGSRVGKQQQPSLERSDFYLSIWPMI